ncbi:hypothetical protein V6N11_064993 [Hibiscus sabdariffa]|uniref:RNase H type-1 domain-containing protein n=1 Tax=Hibiscus sabdariffa TaxID=183260 RepID=A0ABR2SIK1_9ROSI
MDSSFSPTLSDAPSVNVVVDSLGSPTTLIGGEMDGPGDHLGSKAMGIRMLGLVRSRSLWLVRSISGQFRRVTLMMVREEVLENTDGWWDSPRSCFSKKVGDDSVWKSTEDGSFKFNVAGVAKEGRVGCGGVLYSASGTIRGLFSGSIIGTDATLAVILAIKNALELFATTSWAGIETLVVEIDSLVVLNWMGNFLYRPWSYWYVFMETDSLIKQIGKVNFVHSEKPCGGMAAWLEKDGISKSEYFKAWWGGEMRKDNFWAVCGGVVGKYEVLKMDEDAPIGPNSPGGHQVVLSEKHASDSIGKESIQV